MGLDFGKEHERGAAFETCRLNDFYLQVCLFSGRIFGLHLRIGFSELYDEDEPLGCNTAIDAPASPGHEGGGIGGEVKA